MPSRNQQKSRRTGQAQAGQNSSNIRANKGNQAGNAFATRLQASLSTNEARSEKGKTGLVNIDSLASKATETFTPEEMTTAMSSTSADNLTLEDLHRKAQIFDKAIECAETKAKEVEALKKQLEEQQAEIEVAKNNLDAQRQEIATEQNVLSREQTQLNQKAAELSQKEREIHERELNAEAGFIVQNQAALAQLESQTHSLRQERERLYQAIAEKQKQLELEISQKLDKFDQQIATECREIEFERNKLEENRKQLRLEQRKLETERELLQEDKHYLDEKIEQKALARVEQLRIKTEVLEERLKLAQQLREQFQAKLIQRAEADRRFGQKTPDEILEEMETLRHEKVTLEQKLAQRPSEEAAARIRELESQKEAWETERFRLSTKVQELERGIANNRIAVTQLETLRDEKEALEASNNRIRAALEELKTQVNEAAEQSRGKSPFPECSRMDGDINLQTPVPLCENIPNLREFASDLRDRIALSPLLQDTNTEKRLYYSERDIRVFLAGLAMSKLHILQGISGTGKTSLPVAFARAMGGQYQLVEVQAGWRDRQDLIGYFNAFQGRFYESDFLKALYEAQCPANEERLYIVILDEMNLSRPEQYFADFLSKLEQDDPTIGLTTDLDKPSPQLFRNSTTLSIPPNIWFVGTANQDETTLEFADKTYDRSHIMELQRSHKSFALPERLEPRHSVSYQALMAAFNKAQKQHETKAIEAYNFLNDTLADFLERRFKVGWGNRLERQLKDFVPVVIAAGGSLGEATDHILATKILRKIRDRHDTPTSDLKNLKEELKTGWAVYGLEPRPENSLSIIDQEIRRLEPGED